ncbi:MAG: transcriptional regulator GcvA [Arenicellales bacterium]|nr:transcriptional regulator GcvA [Arenicellales bacterium]
MAQRLPPLNALRAFEAAARHLSFTKAAEELYVTQSAISHQVKLLEDYLGIKLFRRLNRALVLTDEGQLYLPPVMRVFDQLHEATKRLTENEARGRLTVSVLPSFAARWLVPRLGQFIKTYPELDVRVAPSLELVDFARDDVDLGIRYGRGRYPGLRVDRLMTEDVFPVCSPELLKGDQPLQQPQDLKHHVLMHDDEHGEWGTWLLSAGVKDIDPTRGPTFTDSSMLIQAAVAGQGVALARGALAADDLASGALVRPFTLSLPVEYAYYIVCPEETADRPKVAAFREWLLQEARGQE